MQRLRWLAALVRKLIGVPDYESYLRHMRTHYPHCTPVDPQTFATERLNARYTRAGQRCC